MTTIILTIPKELLREKHPRLVAVDPKEFEKELRKRWDDEKARGTIKIVRHRVRNSNARNKKS